MSLRSLATVFSVTSLGGCAFIADLLSNDNLIDASCKGDDTVVVDGRDLCKEFEQTGHVECEVGYRIKLNGTQVCPPTTPDP